MNESRATARAFLISLQVCAIALAIFAYVWFEARPEFLKTEKFTIGLILFSIALLTVVVFQSIRVSATASSLAKGLAESMMLYSRELFTELYRNSPVPYLVISNNLTVDSANFAAVRLFGVETGWLEGRRIFDYITGENEQHVALIPEYFAQKVFVNNEEVMIDRPDGTMRWVMLSLFSFTDAHREHKGLLTLVDITKQKEIDRAKTEFVSLASHQLRTPISAMKWNLELLTTSGAAGLTEGERNYLDKIGNGLNRMDTLVSDFLSVSKLELGTLEPHTEKLELGPFLDSILESHEKHAESKQITILREWDGSAIIESDAHLLEMAVSNLISNAVKYTREGGTVRIAYEFHDGKHIIAVSDTGMGIPKDEQDRVFSKIFRATNAKSEVPDGTGLGLYIVREAIRVLGGDVTFVSAENEGTTFTITLPA